MTPIESAEQWLHRSLVCHAAANYGRAYYCAQRATWAVENDLSPEADMVRANAAALRESADKEMPREMPARKQEHGSLFEVVR